MGKIKIIIISAIQVIIFRCVDKAQINKKKKLQITQGFGGNKQFYYTVYYAEAI